MRCHVEAIEPRLERRGAEGNLGTKLTVRLGVKAWRHWSRLLAAIKTPLVQPEGNNNTVPQSSALV